MTQQRKKAYSYLRFSTPEQAKGDSRRRQAKQAVDYAAANNLDLDEKLTFKDLGISAYKGKNAKTGQLGDFLKAVESGQIEEGSYLLVESLDRMSRLDPWEAGNVLRNICKAGITVVTLIDGHEYTFQKLKHDFMSLMMSLMIFARAHEESTSKTHKLQLTWEGKRERIDAGVKYTAMVPGWLWLDKATGKIKVHKARATVVKRIYEMTLAGIGKQSIVRTLNEEKVPMFNERAENWHRSYISRILTTPTVIGTLPLHTVRYDDETDAQYRKPLELKADYYPAIIDKDTWDRVQELQATGSPLRGRHATGDVKNLFGGLAKCPSCGGSMIRVSKGPPPKYHAYLVCSKARVGAGCAYRMVPYTAIEQMFLTHTRPLDGDFTSDTKPVLLNEIPSGNTKEAAKLDREIKSLETALEELPSLIENLVNAIERGRKKGLSSEAMQDRLHTLEAENAPMRAELARLRRQQADTSGKLVALKAEELEAAIAATRMDRRAVNALMRQLWTGVVIDGEGNALTFNWRHGGETTITSRTPIFTKKPRTIKRRKLSMKRTA